jgi:small subunit ribosomal protein S5
MSETTTKTSSTPHGSRPTGNAPRGPRTGGAHRGNTRDGSRGPRTGGPGRGGNRGDRKTFERPKPEFEQKTLSIRRVTRVVSGGRRFSFSVVLAIGDKKGGVGVGIGKAGDTAAAMNKAMNDAKKNMIRVRLTDNRSIEHEVSAKYSSGKVFLMPNTGRGVVVGSSMRTIIELAGIHNITGRVISGTKNKLNIAAATVKALSIFALPKTKIAQKPAEVVEENQ